MKLSSYKEFIQEHKKTWVEDKRTIAKEKFPYTTVVEGNYVEGDFACRWCWRKFGVMDCKECVESYSEYPGCSLVLATEYIFPYTYNDGDGTMKEDSEKRYKTPEKHGHEGNWTIVWLGKTGYDYGFSEYYFKNEGDRDAFVEAVPSFGLGEN